PPQRLFFPYSGSQYSGLSSPQPTAKLRIASSLAVVTYCLSELATSTPTSRRARSMSSSAIRDSSACETSSVTSTPASPSPSPASRGFSAFIQLLLLRPLGRFLVSICTEKRVLSQPL